MSRSISITASQAINAQQTTESFLMKLTIDHADLSAPIRVICDKVSHTISGQTYVGFPFRAKLPPEWEDRAPTASIEIDNVDQSIVQAIRTISSPPTITLEVVLGSNVESVEAGPFDFTLHSVEYDALVVTGSLGYEKILDLASPRDRYVPSHFPGMF